MNENEADIEYEPAKITQTPFELNREININLSPFRKGRHSKRGSSPS